MTDQLKGAASGLGNTVSSGAQGVQNTASSGAQSVQNTVSSSSEATGAQNWEAMTEDQKKATFDSLPNEQKQNMSYTEWVKQGYYHQKENWMPWIEDMYLKWFTNDNKASYATKDSLDKTKVTGIEQVDTVQDSVNNAVGQQVGQGGVLQPVGDMASSEGINRAERGGKDDSGSYAGAIGGYAQSAGGSLLSGAKGAGSYVSGMFGSKGGDQESK